MKEIIVPANTNQVDFVTDFVNDQLNELSCPMRAQMQIDVAIDEIFGNIARYAYNQPNTGEAVIKVESDDDSLFVTITFIDHGKPFDPLKREDPDVTLSAEERDIGGLGIYVVKKTMDGVEYKYEDGKNILSIKKRING